MFTKEISNYSITPNFIHSIMSNKALYDMFKLEFDENKDYFRNIEKEFYLDRILEEIINLLETDNIFEFYDCNIYINFIKTFYDDYLEKLEKENLFKTRLYKVLNEKTRYKDKEKALKVKKVYDYIIETSKYKKNFNKIIKPIIKKLSLNEKLSALEFDLINNYIKNYIDDINIEIILNLIKNHVLGINHIYDEEVVKIIIGQIAKSYFKENIEISFLDNEKNSKNVVYLNENLITKFINGNYLEIFNKLFFKLNMLEKRISLEENKQNFETFKIIAGMINNGVDLNKIFVNENYKPYNFINDEKANSFIQTLKFFESLGVNLVEDYIKSNITSVKPQKLRRVKNTRIISTDIKLLEKLRKMNKDKVKTLINTYPSLALFYTEDGFRVSTIDLIKKSSNKKYTKDILKHLETRIIEPHAMIDDAIELDMIYESAEAQKIIDKLLKYIYVDTFYYSLNFYLELNSNKNTFDYIRYLDDLIIKVNSYTPDISENFVNEVLFIIEEVKKQLTNI